MQNWRPFCVFKTGGLSLSHFQNLNLPCYLIIITIYKSRVPQKKFGKNIFWKFFQVQAPSKKFRKNIFWKNLQVQAPPKKFRKNIFLIEGTSRGTSEGTSLGDKSRHNSRVQVKRQLEGTSEFTILEKKIRKKYFFEKKIIEGTSRGDK